VKARPGATAENPQAAMANVPPSDRHRMAPRGQSGAGCLIQLAKTTGGRRQVVNRGSGCGAAMAGVSKSRSRHLIAFPAARCCGAFLTDRGQSGSVSIGAAAQIWASLRLSSAVVPVPRRDTCGAPTGLAGGPIGREVASCSIVAISSLRAQEMLGMFLTWVWPARCTARKPVGSGKPRIRGRAGAGAGMARDESLPRNQGGPFGPGPCGACRPACSNGASGRESKPGPHRGQRPAPLIRMPCLPTVRRSGLRNAARCGHQLNGKALHFANGHVGSHAVRSRWPPRPAAGAGHLQTRRFLAQIPDPPMPAGIVARQLKGRSPRRVARPGAGQPTGRRRGATSRSLRKPGLARVPARKVPGPTTAHPGAHRRREEQQDRPPRATRRRMR